MEQNNIQEHLMKLAEAQKVRRMKKKIESLKETLKEKEENLEHLESLNHALLNKERKSNDEVQDARKELINVSLLLVGYLFADCCHF